MQKYTELNLSYLGLTKKSIDAYGTIEDTWFKATDIAELIGHSNVKKMIKIVYNKEENVRQFEITVTETRVRTGVTQGYLSRKLANFVSEKGLYQILTRSDLPIARQASDYIFDLLKNKRVKALVEKENELVVAKKIFGVQKQCGLRGLVTFRALAKTLGQGWSAPKLHLFLKDKKVIFDDGRGNKKRWFYYGNASKYFDYDDFNNLQLTPDGCVYVTDLVVKEEVAKKDDGSPKLLVC